MNDTETIDVLVKALALIEANPAHWDQSVWHCGTSHCLAGFCDIVVDGRLDTDLDCVFYPENASIFNHKNQDLDYLFDAGLNLDYLKKEIAYLKYHQSIDGYDSCGFDVDGKDRFGYNSEGYDEGGYDIEGYDRNGYDSDGLNDYSNDKWVFSDSEISENSTETN